MRVKSAGEINRLKISSPGSLAPSFGSKVPQSVAKIPQSEHPKMGVSGGRGVLEASEVGCKSPKIQ